MQHLPTWTSQPPAVDVSFESATWLDGPVFTGSPCKDDASDASSEDAEVVAAHAAGGVAAAGFVPWGKVTAPPRRGLRPRPAAPPPPPAAGRPPRAPLWEPRARRAPPPRRGAKPPPPPADDGVAPRFHGAKPPPPPGDDGVAPRFHARVPAAPATPTKAARAPKARGARRVPAKQGAPGTPPRRRAAATAEVLRSLADPAAPPPPPPPPRAGPLADSLHPLTPPAGGSPARSAGDDASRSPRSAGDDASRSPRSPAASPAPRRSPYAPSPRPRRRADRADPVALFAERQRDWAAQSRAAARRRAGRPASRGRAAPAK